MIGLWVAVALAAPPTLLDAGKAPVPVSYRLKAGATASVRARIATDAAERVGTEPEGRIVLPEVVLELGFTVKSASEAEATVEVRVLRAIVNARPGGEAGASSALQSGFTSGPPLRFEVLLQPRGVREARLAAGITPSASTASIIQIVTETLRLLWPDLPEAPIGAGAKWRAEATRDQEGLAMKVTTDYTNASGNTGTGTGVHVERTERSTGTAPVPDAPAGMKVRFDAAETTLFANISLSRAGLPRSAWLKSSGWLRMVGESNGKPFLLKLSEERQVTLEPL